MRMFMYKTIRVSATLALLFGIQAVSNPANAFCVVNLWKDTLHVKLKTYNPPGKFSPDDKIRGQSLLRMV